MATIKKYDIKVMADILRLGLECFHCRKKNPLLLS